MPKEILNQLHALREGIAETLRKDPRYLTLAALDKSIGEISGVLAATGLLEMDLMPNASRPSQPWTAQEAAARILERRKGHVLPEGETIRSLMEHGRA